MYPRYRDRGGSYGDPTANRIRAHQRRNIPPPLVVALGGAAYGVEVNQTKAAGDQDQVGGLCGGVGPRPGGVSMNRQAEASLLCRFEGSGQRRSVKNSKCSSLF